MDEIVRVLYIWDMVQYPTRICTFKLHLTQHGLGRRPCIFVQLYGYHALG